MAPLITCFKVNLLYYFVKVYSPVFSVDKPSTAGLPEDFPGVVTTYLLVMHSSNKLEGDLPHDCFLLELACLWGLGDRGNRLGTSVYVRPLLTMFCLLSASGKGSATTTWCFTILL